MTNRIAAVDRPIFDVANDNAPLLEDRSSVDWTSPRAQRTRTVSVRGSEDGQSFDRWYRAGIAYYSSGRFSGQAVNDNQDWPLAKLLRTEGREDVLDMAERYRRLYEAANMPVEVRGTDVSDLGLQHRLNIDESTGKVSDKGVKAVKPKDAGAEPAPVVHGGLRFDLSQPRSMSKPIPKAWNGDGPLISKIDARRQLAPAQDALGWLRDPFEAAVVGNDTLEQIGHDYGVGNSTGAKGAGRALVFLGFQALGHHWRIRRAA